VFVLLQLRPLLFRSLGNELSAGRVLLVDSAGESHYDISRARKLERNYNTVLLEG
jgi:hypothetical protein